MCLLEIILNQETAGEMCPTTWPLGTDTMEADLKARKGTALS